MRGISGSRWPPSVRETASDEAETGTDVSGRFKKRVVVRLHARLFLQAVDIGVQEIEVELLSGATFAEPAHRGGHSFDLFIVIHRTDVHVGLHPLIGETGRHRGEGERVPSGLCPGHVVCSDGNTLIRNKIRVNGICV